MALRLEAYRALAFAFAAGALVATSLMDIIPDALELLSRSGSPPPSLSSYARLQSWVPDFYLFEQAAHSGTQGHHHHHHGVMVTEINHAGLFGASGMVFHSLLDGVARGEAFHAGRDIGWIVALAVIIHKFADGVSIVVSVGRSKRVAQTMLALTAIAPFPGLGLQSFLPLPLAGLAIVLSWFAGVFLYLGATALIPAAHAASESRWLPVATLAGVTLVFLASRTAM